MWLQQLTRSIPLRHLAEPYAISTLLFIVMKQGQFRPLKISVLTGERPCRWVTWKRASWYAVITVCKWTKPVKPILCLIRERSVFPASALFLLRKSMAISGYGPATKKKPVCLTFLISSGQKVLSGRTAAGCMKSPVITG